MSAFGPYLRKTDTGFMFRCPGCGFAHVFYTSGPGPRWSFNEDEETPTFTPSLLNRSGRQVDPSWQWEEGDPPEICHLFVRNGAIEYCSDSLHEYAGKTIPLPRWTDD